MNKNNNIIDTVTNNDNNNNNNYNNYRIKLIIKTKDFVDKFIGVEISNFTTRTYSKIENGLYEIDFGNKFDSNENFLVDLNNFILNIVKYSRLIENVYLKIFDFGDDSIQSIEIRDSKNENYLILKENLNYILNYIFDFKINKEDRILKYEVEALKDFNLDHQNFEKIFGEIILRSSNKLKVDLNNFDLSFKLFSTKKLLIKRHYLCIDLIGFNLLKRDYKLNSSSMTINSLIPNYLFYLLGINKIKTNYSILDPMASLGDIVIEASFFNPRLELNMRKIKNLKINKIFDFSKIKNEIHININLNNQDIKLKIYSVVQNNKNFKKLKENLNYSGSKIKVSQYNIDWLDVKFKEDEINYVITQIPEFRSDDERNNFLEEFFYQIEFIFRDGIGIISKKLIEKKYFTKNKLKIRFEEKIYINEQQYYIYIV